MSYDEAIFYGQKMANELRRKMMVYNLKGNWQIGDFSGEQLLDFRRQLTNWDSIRRIWIEPELHSAQEV